uniref:Peptidase M13 N-terminal domain-containing protein n=1 Tax=Hucho hucho TaxID=62062 RepID=A0A4W5KAM8_9TELE
MINPSSQVFDWSYFTRKIMGTVGITVPDTESVINYAPNYYKRLSPVLAKYTKRDLQNYMVWRFVMNMVVGLSKQYRDTRKAFRKVRTHRLLDLSLSLPPFSLLNLLFLHLTISLVCDVISVSHAALSPAGAVRYHVGGGGVAAVCHLRQQQYGQRCRKTVRRGGLLRREQRTGEVNEGVGGVCVSAEQWILLICYCAELLTHWPL